MLFLGSAGARGPLCDIFGVGAAVQGGASIAGAAIQADAAKHAADVQSQSAANALAQQQGQFNTQQQNIQPYLQAGKGALNQLTAGTQPGGSLVAPYGQQFSYNGGQPFSFSGVNEQNDPGYQFRLEEGQRALDHAAAATGKTISGAQLKAAQQYGQNYASGEYGNAYNRAFNNYQQGYNNALGTFNTNYNVAQNNQNNQFNRLASIAGLGQTGNSQLGQASQNYANNASNLLTQSGNAQAAGAIGVGNAVNSGLSGIGNALQNYQIGQALNASSYNPPASSYFNGPDDLSASLNALSNG